MPAKPESLVIVPVPALVAVLLAGENAKESPLTEAEVISIRDNAASIAMTLPAMLKVQQERGYIDIDARNAWLEWQLVRPALRGAPSTLAGGVFTAQAMADFLGRSPAVLLSFAPFNDWPFEVSLDESLKPPRIDYVFRQNGLGLICDGSGTINTIFLDSGARGPAFPADLSDIPWSSSRQQVIEALGSPEKSGAPINDPILGAYGGWTRFSRPGYSIHVQYRAESDRVDRITLMREDVVPK